jgi:hypothetical protein
MTTPFLLVKLDLMVYHSQMLRSDLAIVINYTSIIPGAYYMSADAEYVLSSPPVVFAVKPFLSRTFRPNWNIMLHAPRPPEAVPGDTQHANLI